MSGVPVQAVTIRGRGFVMPEGHSSSLVKASIGQTLITCEPASSTNMLAQLPSLPHWFTALAMSTPRYTTNGAKGADFDAFEEFA